MLRLLVCTLLCFQVTFAAKYYLAANGNDNLSGTTPQNAWQNLSKLTQVTLAAGDTVYLRCGDTFRGSISLTVSGTANAPIVLTSYGIGAKPIISGAITVAGWTNSSGTYVANMSQKATAFFANNTRMQPARYPNVGNYLTLDSAKTGYLKDADLTQATNYWAGAQVCIHTAQWCWEKTKVSTSQTGLVNFSTATRLPAANKYGYFFFNKYELLDTAREWFMDTVQMKLYYKPENGTNPAAQTCEATVLTYGIQLSGTASYITIAGLAFDKQLQAGVLMGSNNVQHITVYDCDFTHQYNHGVYANGQQHEIANNNFTDVRGHGADINGTGSVALHHNTFRRIGMYREDGIGGETNLSAVAVNFASNCHIHHNTIDSAGYCGISADGAYHLVERNIVDHVMLLNNDGAALKAYGAQSHHSIFRNNFVRNYMGNTEGVFTGQGSNVFQTPGIYFDFSVNNCLIKDNTIENVGPKGIFQNSGTHHNRIDGNVVYGSLVGIDLNGNPIIQTPITNDSVVHNAILVTDPSGYCLRQVDYSGSFNTGRIDSNYYFNPYASNVVMRINNTTPTYYTLANWQAQSTFDDHTTGAFVSWTLPTNNAVLASNPSENLLTLDLGSTEYRTLANEPVCGTLELAPYTSKILIDMGVTCSQTSRGTAAADQLVAWPNPTNDVLNIAWPAQPGIATLLDAQGRTVATGTTQLATAHLAPGIYVLVAEANGQRYVRKIMK